MESKRYSVPLASRNRGVHPGVHEGNGEYTDMVHPYVDLNFSEPPKWIVDVKFKEWRNLPQNQKNLMIKERLMNARTSEELNLAYNLR